MFDVVPGGQQIMKEKDFGLLFWLHLGLILFAYVSPLWLNWKIIVGVVVVLQLYYALRGGCDITFWEFGDDKDTTFLWYYLRKIFPTLDQKKTKFFVRIIVPALVILIALISQIVFNYHPYMSLH